MLTLTTEPVEVWVFFVTLLLGPCKKSLKPQLKTSASSAYISICDWCLWNRQEGEREWRPAHQTSKSSQSPSRVSSLCVRLKSKSPHLWQTEHFFREKLLTTKSGDHLALSTASRASPSSFYIPENADLPVAESSKTQQLTQMKYFWS